MFGLEAAPFAPLLEFDFALDKLFVLARPIVNAGTFGAGEPYELILRHRQEYTKKLSAGQCNCTFIEILKQ